MLNRQDLDIKQLLEVMRSYVPSAEPERFYSREKTAEILDISVEKLDMLRKANEISHRKVASLIKFSKSDIEEFQNRCKIEAISYESKK